MNGLRSGWKYIALVIVLTALALLIMDFNSRTAKLRYLTAERDSVSARATQVMETQNALQVQIAYATSEPAVEDWAYEDGHLIRPGDIPVVPIGDASITPTPTPIPTPAPTASSFWERWLNLFFGDK